MGGSEGGGVIYVLCDFLRGFMGCLCGFSKCEFKFKVLACRLCPLSAMQAAYCVCVCAPVCLISEAVTCLVCVIAEDLHGQKSIERSEWP